jgi:hypothetical protein
MTRADLDDALRLALAHQGIGDGGIERGKPGLLEQAMQALERRGVRVDEVDHAAEALVVACEQFLDE